MPSARVALFGFYLADVRLRRVAQKTICKSGLLSFFIIQPQPHSRPQTTFTTLTSTMFKSILPSRKLPDTDFTMVTPDPALNGKENYPAIGTNVSRLRGEKSKKSKGKEVNQSIPTEQAFAKLLVSSLRYLWLTCLTCRRMISRYPLRLGRSSRRWSHR